jgi:hypothetical protein
MKILHKNSNKLKLKFSSHFTKKFCDKNILNKDHTINNHNILQELKNFNLNFDKGVSFENFQTQMLKNIEIGMNPDLKEISSSKLLEILKEGGNFEKTKEEIEVMSKIITAKGKDNVKLIFIKFCKIFFLNFNYKKVKIRNQLGIWHSMNTQQNTKKKQVIAKCNL